MALETVIRYLEAAKSVPGRLLDFACAAIYGGQVDLPRQRKHQLALDRKFNPQLDRALELVRGIPTHERAQTDEYQAADEKLPQAEVAIRA